MSSLFYSLDLLFGRKQLNARLFLRSLFLLMSVFGGISSWNACYAESKTRPNILLIMTDDQGYGDLGIHGNTKIDTPVMDRLAKESTRFDRFMVSPLCSMTRASLLTGRYHLRTGCASVTRGVESVRPDEVMISEILKEAGYVTGCFGKWHIGEHYPSHPNGQGFDHFFGMPQGHWDNYFNPTLEENGKMVKTKGYISDVLTTKAIKFISKHHQEPFFCYLPYNAPHTPMQVDDRYYNKYRAKGLGEKCAAIHGMIQNIDENLGRLLNVLDQLKIAENTVVIFLSDNGPEGPDPTRYLAGMRGKKGDVHEGGVRVPLFIRWKGKTKQNHIVKNLTAHIDLLPTIAELCGIKKLKTKPLDGQSLVPLLFPETDSLQNNQWQKDRMIFARNPGWKSLVGFDKPVVESVKVRFPGAVRTNKWRAVNEGNGWQLYDMQNDPGQKMNIATDHPKVVKQFATEYENWYKDVTSVPIKRPIIDVGHPQWSQVKLTVPEAYFTGNIRWYNRWGFAHDWLTDWTTTDETIWWETNIIQSGQYEVSLKFACPEDSVGTKLQVEASGNKMTGTINKSHLPNPVQRPTRIKKNRFVQTFIRQKLGIIDLKKGRTKISIKAINKTGKIICDIHSLIFRRIHP